MRIINLEERRQRQGSPQANEDTLLQAQLTELRLRILHQRMINMLLLLRLAVRAALLLLILKLLGGL